jgi:hypothetical protein
MSWSTEFDAPIVLDDGRELVTLRDAGQYVTGLPKKEQAKPHWQTAAHELLTAAEHGGIVMLAWIAMRQALIAEKQTTPPEPRKKAAKKIHGDPMKTVWIYVNTDALPGDVNHLQIFASEEAAQRWFDENDPEGVAFEYPVQE